VQYERQRHQADGNGIVEVGMHGFGDESGIHDISPAINFVTDIVLPGSQ
jgi:hypothetical protein